MTKKEQLAAREAECSGAADYAALAREAAAEPAYTEYARHLLQEGEAQCQFPAEFRREGQGAEISASRIK